MQKIEEILEFIKSKRANIQYISKETGISADKLYSWRNKRGTPKAEDSQILLDWWDKNSKTSNKTEEIQNEPQETVSVEALYKLIDANQKLADGYKNTSEANLRLTKMLELQQTTGGADQQMQPVLMTMLRGLQEVVMRIGTGERFASTNEVAALLYKSDPDSIPKVSVGGTQKG